MCEASKRLLIWWIKAFCIFVFICTYTASYGQAPTPTEGSKKQNAQPTHSQKPATKDQRGTEKSPLIIKIAPTPKSQEEATQERKDRENRATNERLLIVANILLVIFTAILAICTGMLWWVSKRTAERQLRAYIQVGGDKGPDLEAPQGPEIHMFLKNTGQTPAFDLTHWFNVGILEFPLKKDPPGPDPSVRMTKGVVQPGADIKFVNKLGRPLDRETINQIREGNRYRLYVWGEITYRDAFNQSHFTRFRLMHGGPESDVGTLLYCEEGNDAN